MSRLHVTTWRWGDKYPQVYLDRWKSGILRNLHQPFHFGVFAPKEEDEYLTKISGCMCRLRMFDPEWQAEHNIEPGDRIVLCDLDVVITGGLDVVFDRDEDFVILQGANASNPCPYNGSLQLLKAGTHSDVWSDFSTDAVNRVSWYDFPDDQAWLAAKIPNAAGWKAGKESGVYAFQKPGWPNGVALPPEARIVCFPGWRDPARFDQLQWIRKHWRKDVDDSLIESRE